MRVGASCARKRLRGEWWVIARFWGLEEDFGTSRLTTEVLVAEEVLTRK